ncbi:MAG: helicase-related protein, partial [Variovorax sp.]
VPTVTHVFNFGLPMKAEDYTHRIGRTGRAGRDGLAVTFAEFRDRRKIGDIEAYSGQNFKPEVIAGLEPQQRFQPTRPRADFAGRGRGSRETPSRDRKFGGGGRGDAGGFARRGESASFDDRFGRGTPRAGNGAHAPRGNAAFGAREPAPAFGRKPGWGDGAPRRAYKPSR